MQRLFFALWPDDSTRSALAHAVRKGVRASGGRPVPLSNLHVTLAFLGAVPDDSVTPVCAAAAATSFEPFRIVFDRLEHWAKPAVLCVTASVRAPAGENLARSLRHSLERCGIQVDPKPWRAHVTLARNVVKPHFVGVIEPVAWFATGFALVASETLPRGTRYTVVQTWP